MSGSGRAGSGRGLRAVVTGIGAVSGFGAGADTLWRALGDGERAMRADAGLARIGIEGVVAVAPGVDPFALGDRATPLALAAAMEAVSDAGGVTAGDGLAIAFGSTLGGIGAWLDGARGATPWSEVDPRGFSWAAPARAIASAHGASGPLRVVSTACASGNGALGAALALVRSGRAQQVIAGGADALNDFVVAGFSSLKALDPSPCRPFDRARRGLNLGEGAGFLIIEEESFARRRGAPIRAFLDGYGEAADAHHMTGPERDGRGAAEAMRFALIDAECDPGAIDHVSAHGTATNFNDAMEGRALSTVFGARAASVPVNSIKGSIGHTMGAAGALEALVCVRTLETGRIVPTVGLEERDPEIALDVVAGAARAARVSTVLSTSSGFGGINAAIVMRRA